MDNPKKQLGQHWLQDEASLMAIVSAAQVQPGDQVLEIGPGTGLLTRQLLLAGATVTAVELDDERIAPLQKQFAGAPFTLIHQNILRFDFASMPDSYKLVANIPYYLTAHLFRILSETSNPPLMAVLLVQQEVAERVAAKPGAMSLLAVTIQYYWQVETGIVIDKSLFDPSPKVDSQVIMLSRRPEPLFPGTDTKLFFRLVKAGFAARRKTLLNSLSGGMRLPKETINEVLQKAGIDGGVRPQELSLEQWHQLYTAFNS
jgi:16S rRNA (adenine1518-N6/adenine1519-N6)-dimethyltransferase